MFKNAEIGDLVYSMIFGKGMISSINRADSRYPIAADFKDTDHPLTVDGKTHHDDAEPTVFYRNEKSNYLTERPIVIDWSQVPPGTICSILNEESGERFKRNFRFYAENKPWFGDIEVVVRHYDNVEIST